MANASVRSHSKPKKAAVKAGQYMGVTKDGVKILRPKFKPKNFTEAELRQAVAKALVKSA